MKVRTRFWVEAVLSTGSGLLAVLTIVWSDWIEIVFRVDPDHGDGSLEWAIVAVCAVSAVVFSVIARHEFRRPRVATA